MNELFLCCADIMHAAKMTRINVVGERYPMSEAEFFAHWFRTHRKRLKNIQQGLGEGESELGLVDVAVQAYSDWPQIVEHGLN